MIESTTPAAGTPQAIGRTDPRPLHLVFGASGYIGSNLVPRAAAPRASACAPRRATSRCSRRAAGTASSSSQADALDPATLPAALAGVDVAYYLVHSMAAGRDFGRDRPRRRRRTSRAAAAALACGASSTSAA
ncbi:MAG: hypothetical protein MZV65_31385 [Chromatiales bacterium]|nr:hypothetical protein [Chromatiales bacterium]